MKLKGARVWLDLILVIPIDWESEEVPIGTIPSPAGFLTRFIEDKQIGDLCFRRVTRDKHNRIHYHFLIGVNYLYKGDDIVETLYNEFQRGFRCKKSGCKIIFSVGDEDEELMSYKDDLRREINMSIFLMVRVLAEWRASLGEDLYMAWVDLKYDARVLLGDDIHSELVEELPKLIRRVEMLRKHTSPRLTGETKRHFLLMAKTGCRGYFKGLEDYFRQYLDGVRNAK